jgi:hypothetical protein
VFGMLPSRPPPPCVMNRPLHAVGRRTCHLMA